MKKYLLLLIGITVCLLSFAGCRDLLPGTSSRWEEATPFTTTVSPEAGTTASSAATTVQVTTQTIRNASSHPVIKKTGDKTTAKPVTAVTTTATTTATTTTKSTTLATLPAGDVRQEVFALVNEQRAQNGKGALIYRSDAQACADLRAQEIVESFDHTRPNGSSCFTVLDEAGVVYMAAGENIAFGQRSADEAMTDWMNSEGHRLNILREEFTGIVVGYAEHNGVKYWVQLFVA